MKETQEFLDFQKYFKEYQNRFGLNGYKVYFKYENVTDSFADITTGNGDMVATVRLSSKIPKGDKPFINIKDSAKHEAIHLLISRLSDLAYNRFVTNSQIYETSEELVRKIQSLIPD